VTTFGKDSSWVAAEIDTADCEVDTTAVVLEELLAPLAKNHVRKIFILQMKSLLLWADLELAGNS
jgi:hypothetical protein